MKNILCLAAVIAAPLFSSPMLVAVEQAVPPAAAQPVASKLDQRVDKIAAQLDLSDFQKGELKELLVQRREVLRRADAIGRRQFRAQLRDILTPEQKAKWVNLMAARKKAAAEAEAAHPTP